MLPLLLNMFISRSLEPVNISLHGKRNFANVIKDPQKGDYLGGLDLIKWIFYEGLWEELLREGNVMTETEQGEARPRYADNH